jgi:hypothetical protein
MKDFYVLRQLRREIRRCLGIPWHKNDVGILYPFTLEDILARKARLRELLDEFERGFGDDMDDETDPLADVPLRETVP